MYEVQCKFSEYLLILFLYFYWPLICMHCPLKEHKKATFQASLRLFSFQSALHYYRSLWIEHTLFVHLYNASDTFMVKSKYKLIYGEYSN
jgi:hypothetical protein